ncbi:hypothetical protein [Verrucosispora sp. ts21]|uniref:hypothetical protein n=1 Tax=Verrucosispora sp. ts21 TaxID=2069341 RepID=UPI0011AF40D4|nr:hypothetical protein [Verrucosispora sp. ts21]
MDEENGWLSPVSMSEQPQPKRLTNDQADLLAKYVTAKLEEQEAERRRIIGMTRHSTNGRFQEWVHVEMSEHGLSYSQAADKVAQEHPDLYEQYRIGAANS